MSNTHSKDEVWHVGNVKFFDQEKGFGFLEDYVADEDIFAHQSDLASQRITGGDIVAFRVVSSQRKKGSDKAVRVTLLEEHDEGERLSEKFAGKIASRSLHIGRVKFFDSVKGFGFIKNFRSSKDIYVNEENITSRRIDDTDYVVFETRPSKSKKDSQEAVKVSLLKEYSGEGKILLEHIDKVDGEAEKLMIRRLDGPALHALVEQRTEEHVTFNSRSVCQKVIRLHEEISQNEIVDDKTREAVLQRLKLTAVHKTGARGRAYFWLEGWCEQPPLDDVAAAMAESWSEQDNTSNTLVPESHAARHRMLLKFDDAERPRLFAAAVRKAARSADTASQLDRVRAVLSAGIDWIDDDFRFWFDERSRSERQALIASEERAEQEQAFYALGAEAVRATCSEEVRLELFFEGFLSTYPEAHLKEKLSELTREQLAQVFSHDSTEAHLTEELLHGRVSCVQKRDGVSQIEEVKWIFEKAEEHLSKEAGQVLREKVVDELPAETLLALFFEGHVSKYPSAQVHRHERAEKLPDLTHEQLEQVLAHPDTENSFAQNLLRTRLTHAQEKSGATGGGVTSEARWILAAAETHLSKDAANALREQALRTLPAETRLRLFFEGKVPDYPQEHVREAAPGLSHEQLEKVLSHPDTSFNFAQELLSNRFASKRDDLTHKGWTREARGMLEAADEQASSGAALRRYVLREVPEAVHFELFSQGQTETFPREYVRQSAEKVNRHMLEQAIAREVMPSAFVRDVLRDRLEHDVEGDNPLSKAKWVLRVAEEHLEDDDVEALRQVVLELFPAKDCLVLWEEGRIDEMPAAHIRQQLADGEGRVFEKGPQWVQDERIEPEALATLVINSLASLPTIKHHNDYARLEKRLSLLGAAAPQSLVRAREEVRDEQRDFVRLFSWLNGYDEAFDFETFRSRVVYLAPDDQVAFLRKLFHLHRQGEFVLTAGKLDRLTRVDINIFSIAEAQGVEETLDLSVEIVIQVVRSVQKDGIFPRQSDLLKIVYHGTTRRDRMQVEDLFDECEGRAREEWDWHSQRGTVRKEENSHFVIEFDYDEYLVEAVKQLPGRRYNPNGKYWTVPARHQEDVFSFAREHRFFIDLPDGKHKTNNTHFRDLRRGAKPRGVNFCEGRKYERSDVSDCDAWYCRGEVCYKNSAPGALREKWENYTLRDMLRILNYRFDEKKRADDDKRPTEVISEGEYFNFVHLLNRFNEILDHLHCRECEQIIYPVEAGNFGYYRVSHFHCTNELCAECGKEVYLHHCLNGKCRSVIDSRDTTECPEGWWICTNERCGCCCSHEINKERLENLQRTGGYVPQSLKEAVDSKTGHLERALHYCYRCGQEMNEYELEKFRCKSCGIEYRTAHNNFDRYHR